MRYTIFGSLLKNEYSELACHDGILKSINHRCPALAPVRVGYEFTVDHEIYRKLDENQEVQLDTDDVAA